MPRIVHRTTRHVLQQVLASVTALAAGAEPAFASSSEALKIDDDDDECTTSAVYDIMSALSNNYYNHCY